MVELSIEVGHLYFHNMTERAIEQAAEQAARWVGPVLARHPEGSYTISVLLDDYSPPRKRASPMSVEEGQAAVVRVFEQMGVRLDYVVMEAACAATANRLKSVLTAPEPRYASEIGWLSNGDPVRMQLTPSRYAHAIALDVQLWKEENGCVRWACPMVAAWWQLIRMGAVDELPAGSWARPGAPSLAARRTLTLLDTDYLEVEHAVVNIIKHVMVPETWPHEMQTRLVDKMAYIFVPAGE